MRILTLTAVFTLSALSSAHAANVGPIDLSAQLNIGSDGVIKGISETDGNAQAVGTITAAKGPFFAGIKIKNVKGSDGSDGQTQMFGGAKGDIAGFKASLQLLYKANQNARLGVDDDFYEWQSDISRSFNKVTTVKYTAVYSPDSSGSTKEAWWHDLSVAQKLNGQWSLSGGIGVRKTTPKKDYTAYNLGATYQVNPKTGLDLRYYDTDKNAYGKRFGERLVLTLSQKF